ncbi:MAG: hypothetical protein ACE5G1_12015 [bacterium]
MPRDIVMNVEGYFWETYGGPWRFNQTVGWLRMSFAGSQIRADLWFTRAKKLLRRPRHRQFSLIGKVFELHCWPDQSSKQIYESVLNELKQFQKKFRGGRLVLDLECFSNLGPHVNWCTLIAPVGRFDTLNSLEPTV